MKIQKTSKNLSIIIKDSVEIAKNNNFVILDENILFVALLSVAESAAVRALQEFDIDTDSTAGSVLLNIKKNYFDIKLTPQIVKPNDDNFSIMISPLYKKILEDAYKVAINMSAPYVGTEHLLIAWYEDVGNNEIKNNLNKKGIDDQSLYNAIKDVVKYPVFIDDKSINEKNSIIKILGRNITDIAKKGLLDPVVGREKEMDRMASILMRRTKNNPILLGDAGVGKTAIVEGFVQKIAREDGPYLFKNKNIWQIDSATLFASSPMRGDIENKLLALIEEVSNDPSIILFIDEIHSIMGGGSSGAQGSEVANILKPALAKGNLRCIGATTYAEYVKYIESDPALARRFQPITVDEIDPISAQVIINRIKPTLENHHHVAISEDIVSESIDLSERYITERYLPDKAIDLLDEASARVNIKRVGQLNENVQILSTLDQEQQKFFAQNNFDAAAKVRNTKRQLEKLVDGVVSPHNYRSSIKLADLKQVVSEWTGIPISSLTTADIQKIQNLPKLLSNVVIGQQKAVQTVSDALQVAKVGISDEKRPLASFLFAGPTGVGKTELARQVADLIFGSKDSLIQLDMSEYMEAHSISKIIGSPPGYIGFDIGGQLTEKVRKKPYSVILFDEIEKAHPDVLNILLQTLEEGKLTDSKGRIANFKNTVIVMTTNLGADAILHNEVLGLKVNKKIEDKAETAYLEMEDTVLDKIKNYLQPELINRIDHIVIFRSLNPHDIEKITEIQLNSLCARIKKYKKIDINFSSRLTKKIAKEGFSKEYGARNVKRKIQELVESQISKYILSNKKILKELLIDYDKDRIVIS